MGKGKVDEELKQFVLEEMDEREGKFSSKEEFEKQKEVMLKIFAEGKTPQEATQLDDILLESLYGFGYHLYNNGQYGKAILLFRLLTTLNPNVSKYFLGLAASLHLAEEYDSAIGIYTLVAGMEKESPIPYYHASDCYQKLENSRSAWCMMKLAWARMGDNPKYKKLKARTEILLDTLFAKAQKEGTSESKEKPREVKEATP